MNASDPQPTFTTRIYYVYHKDTGRIVLTHAFSRPEDAVSNEGLTEQAAIAEASRRSNISPAALAVISRDASRPIEGTVVRVDPATCQLEVNHERLPRKFQG